MCMGAYGVECRGVCRGEYRSECRGCVGLSIRVSI